MAELDRDYLLDQLEKLGSEDDATVLAAARAAHRHVEESGFDWDDVLEPDEDEYDEDDIVDDDDDDDINHGGPDTDADADDDQVDALSTAAIDDEPMQSGDEGRLIAQLLVHDAVTDDTREDLAEMQTDFENGELSAMDRRFVQALAKRLDVR